MPAQERGEARGRERLGDDLGRPGAQRLDGACAARRERQGRDGRAAGPRLEDDGGPLGGGQIEIDEAEVDMCVRRSPSRAIASAALVQVTGSPSSDLTSRASSAPTRGIVVDDEDPFRHLHRFIGRAEIPLERIACCEIRNSVQRNLAIRA